MAMRDKDDVAVINMPLLVHPSQPSGAAVTGGHGHVGGAVAVPVVAALPGIGHGHHTTRLRLLCINCDNLSSTVQFILLSIGGIISFHLSLSPLRAVAYHCQQLVLFPRTHNHKGSL